MARISKTKLAEVPQVGFHFDEESHLYFLDGKPLQGVTTVLQVISKPSLIQWAADMACNYIAEKWKDQTAIDMPTWLAEARLAHRKKKEAAGDIGKRVHKTIENMIKSSIKTNNGTFGGVTIPADIPSEQESKMVVNFFNWAVDNKVKFLASEKKVYSRTHWLGGTYDMRFELDGKTYIGDVKTSSGIYKEHFFQMGAYEIAEEEMGEGKVDGYLVINLRKDGEMELKVTENREINKQAFLHALGLYKIINSLE